MISDEGRGRAAAGTSAGRLGQLVRILISKLGNLFKSGARIRAELADLGERYRAVSRCYGVSQAEADQLRERASRLDDEVRQLRDEVRGLHDALELARKDADREALNVSSREERIKAKLREALDSLL
jgi:hypothetical protein